MGPMTHVPTTSLRVALRLKFVLGPRIVLMLGTVLSLIYRSLSMFFLKARSFWKLALLFSNVLSPNSEKKWLPEKKGEGEGWYCSTAATMWGFTHLQPEGAVRTWHQRQKKMIHRHPLQIHKIAVKNCFLRLFETHFFSKKCYFPKDRSYVKNRSQMSGEDGSFIVLALKSVLGTKLAGSGR